FSFSYGFVAALLALILLAVSCTSTDKVDNFMTREQRAATTIASFKRSDPGLKHFFELAQGFAVFPKVLKAAMIAGGARGDGVVYEQGNVIGWSTLTQGSVGAQIGGQAYSEIVFFRDSEVLERFKAGHLEFDAQASAVFATAGTSANADYAAGVAVFTMPSGGLMIEASIGGQHFSFEPK
ncbi:MAG: lipid-binding SYLF domain-containing protein, partial [Pirellulaceae bacterium]|nr:lipid-binding SYLF domain-containing protein [Pirellulaceae bacterium]